MVGEVVEGSGEETKSRSKCSKAFPTCRSPASSLGSVLPARKTEDVTSALHSYLL